LYEAITRGATPFASVEPGCETSDVPVLSCAKMPSKICSLSSLKVVVAKAARQAELLARRHGHFAEEGELIQLVA
jgi:hypothetical protein